MAWPFRRLPTALAGVAFLLLASAAPGQDNFRITYDVDRRPNQVRLVGRVVNEGQVDVFEVSVTAEALDARGRVVASGISYVDSRIGRGESRPFVAVVPAAPMATRYRVGVSSFRAGFGYQAP
ncbi:MAG TPA: FxLYD domain-containing protein [Methylomirabilota bacterium]|nr:FxLYD domain-containing protein [Methylomirabilota bacterium]